MSEVWIACDDPAPLRNLLLALGSTLSVRTTSAPGPTEAEVFELQNGRVVLVPGKFQLHQGRPVIGVMMSTPRAPQGPPFQGRQHVGTSRSRDLIGPKDAHGLWLEFRAER